MVGKNLMTNSLLMLLAGCFPVCFYSASHLLACRQPFGILLCWFSRILHLAGAPGNAPGSMDSKSIVLLLNYTPKFSSQCNFLWQLEHTGSHFFISTKILALGHPLDFAVDISVSFADGSVW